MVAISNRERKFETLADIALIDESEFERFLPDFVAWFYAAKSMQDLGGTVTNMTWFDDGKPGELSAIDIRTSDGQVEKLVVRDAMFSLLAILPQVGEQRIEL